MCTYSFPAEPSWAVRRLLAKELVFATSRKEMGWELLSDCNVKIIILLSKKKKKERKKERKENRKKKKKYNKKKKKKK